MKMAIEHIHTPGPWYGPSVHDGKWRRRCVECGELFDSSDEPPKYAYPEFEAKLSPRGRNRCRIIRVGLEVSGRHPDDVIEIYRSQYPDEVRGL